MGSGSLTLYPLAFMLLCPLSSLSFVGVYTCMLAELTGVQRILCDMTILLAYLSPFFSIIGGSCTTPRVCPLDVKSNLLVS